MRLWARHGTGDAAVDEFEMYMRLLGWRKKAGYHREARKPECAAGPGSNSTPHRNPNQAREGEHAFVPNPGAAPQRHGAQLGGTRCQGEQGAVAHVAHAVQDEGGEPARVGARATVSCCRPPPVK